MNRAPTSSRTYTVAGTAVLDPSTMKQSKTPWVGLRMRHHSKRPGTCAKGAKNSVTGTIVVMKSGLKGQGSKPASAPDAPGPAPVG